jgi:hypothetical protein
VAGLATQSVTIAGDFRQLSPIIQSREPLAEEPRGDRLIAALRDLGATVDARAQMHEKIAILDGHILWHGSLNILSHRDTHESMLRIDSPTACQQIGRFVSVRTN